MKNCIFLVATFLTLSLSHGRCEQLRGGDPFQGNALDLEKWNPQTVVGGGDFLQYGAGVLRQEPARLYYNYATIGIPNPNVLARWVSNNGSFTNSWIAQVDVRIGPATYDTFPLLQPLNGDFYIGMVVFNKDDPGDSFNVFHRTFKQGDSKSYQISSAGSLNGDSDDVYPTEWPIASETVSLQIQYCAPDQVLVFYYDKSGPSNGYQWELAAFQSALDWGMGPGSQFSIALTAGAPRHTVNKTVFYFSNFLAISGPVLITLLQAQQARPGGTAVFAIQHEPDPTITYQWRKNGDDIPGKPLSTLTITGISQNDIADYSVLLTNEAGELVSNKASLSIGVRSRSRPRLSET